MAVTTLGNQLMNTQGLPLDARAVIDGSMSSSFESIPNAYVGMQVYSKADGKLYLVKSVSNKKVVTYEGVGSGTDAVATTSSNGLMSSTDKSDLEELKENQVTMEAIQDAMEALPDGSAVSAQVAVLEATSATLGTSTENGDLDIADENGNVLARFKNGHIKTKNFDSSNSGINYTVIKTI